MQLDNNSLIMQWNRDVNGNPVSRHIAREVQQVSPTHNLIQLTQIPDNYYPVRIVTEDNIELIETPQINDVTETTFYVDYGLGLVHFHESLSAKMIIVNYYGRGVMLISDSRIFHRKGDTIADTWDNIIERSQDALDLIEHAGGLAGAIEIIDQKVQQGNQVADRLEDFITETQFYGYTITLSREAFVVKADDNGEVGKTEISSVYTDVLVYKGAKQIVPTLTISNEQGCTFKVEGQRVKLTNIDINFIKTNAILNIDCGDGLIAQRVLEVTKVFDGVNQYQVSMTNPFFSFRANSEGYIEDPQSIVCELKVSKANIEYENYQIQVQNAPQGLNYKIGKDNVTFTGIEGRLLPSSGTCLIVTTIDGQSFNNSFSWNKVKKGEDAKSLKLVGSQIIRYETPDFSDIPSQTKTTVSAKITGLSGTPRWSFFSGTDWVILENETSTELTFVHNDATIWADRKEVTIKCELEGYSDELTIVKLANGVSGNDAITVILTNESHTVAIDDSGAVTNSEIEKTRTTVLAYKGVQSVIPTVKKGKCVGCDVEIIQDVVQLISLDNSFTSSTAELIIEVEGITLTKVWTISKSKQGQQGQNGQNGSTYILNVTGGTRSITYSQINHDPRPSTSTTFMGSLYADGVEILEGVSWYWIANGHFEGSSISSDFTPTIKKLFDESITNNSIVVTVSYKGQSITQEVPLSVTKDANGLDWVQQWDSTKTEVRGSLILTPKIFAGHYDQENDLVTGVAIGQDILSDGRTIGIAGYQNNIPTFLLDVDGSVQLGNPFEENSTGMYYSEGFFKLRVNELSIEGVEVPNKNEISDIVNSEINSAKGELQLTIDSISQSLGSLEDNVNNALKDGILTEVEKSKLRIMFSSLEGEVVSFYSQVSSVLGSPFLTNVTLIELLTSTYDSYAQTFENLEEVYNRILLSETPSDEDVALFNDLLLQLRELSETLNQVLIDCLTNISKEQSTQLVNQAKEEIKVEVEDVNNALNELENTINGDFKAGLVTSINLANLENQLQQLAKEKADIDAQYNIIYNNPKLSNGVKSKLLQAKSDYDIAHDTLVAKINTSIADNLMTEQELKEINALIKTYTEKLGVYSGVAQEANADIALQSAQSVVEALDQEAIFNKLTNNGEKQGIYLKDGKIYLNSEYQNTRNFKAVRDDGTKTFEIDSEGNASGRFKSFYLIGDDTNIANKDYVDEAVNNISIGSINIILSNETQVIATSSTSYPLSSQAYSTHVQMYKGATEVLDFTIGTVSSANGITVSVNQNTKMVTFSVSNSIVIGSDSGAFTIPIIHNGKTYNKKWTWAIAKQGVNGVSGNDGVSITTIAEKYYLSTSQQTLIGGAWLDNAPTWEKGKYIWTKTVFTYSNGLTEETTPICVTGKDGEDGLNGGVSVSDVDVYYYQSDSATSLVGGSWTTTAPTWASGKYVWTKTITFLDNNSQIESSAICITGEKGQDGQDGQDGRGVSSIKEQYYLSTSMTSLAGGSWSDGVPTASRGKFIWTRSVITYTDLNTTTTTPVCVSGADGTNGANGANGEDGVGITNVDVEYAQNTSPTTAPTSGWQTTSPTWVSGKYIWSRTKTTYSDSKITYSEPACITGQKGDTGANGANGANAKSVDIVSTSQVFKSTDGGKTFSPDTITLTPTLQNVSYSNWQYSTNGGSTWSTVTSGQNGLTIIGNNLTISKTSALFTNSATSIVFRVNTNDSAIYDTMTIVKLYDVTEMSQSDIFNKLTNNGQTQGIFLENGKIYINGEYVKINSLEASAIVAGSITARELKVGTITADKLHADVLSAKNIVSIINGGSTTISGDKITTGSVTADKINIKGLVVTDTGGNTTFKIDANGNTTIGGKVETYGTNGRKAMEFADTNIRFYSSEGGESPIGRIGTGALMNTDASDVVVIGHTSSSAMRLSYYDTVNGVSGYYPYMEFDKHGTLKKSMKAIRVFSDMTFGTGTSLGFGIDSSQKIFGNSRDGLWVSTSTNGGGSPNPFNVSVDGSSKMQFKANEAKQWQLWGGMQINNGGLNVNGYDMTPVWGTYSPALYGNDNITFAMSRRDGRFCKVGKLVTIYARVVGTRNNSSGYLRMTLPYVVRGGYWGATICFTNGISAGSGQVLKAYAESGGNFVNFSAHNTTSGSGWRSIHCGNDIGSRAVDIAITITYETD